MRQRSALILAVFACIAFFLMGIETGTNIMEQRYFTNGSLKLLKGYRLDLPDLSTKKDTSRHILASIADSEHIVYLYFSPKQ